MGCNCKGGENNDMDSLLAKGGSSNENKAQKISSYIFKGLAFLLSLALLPVINLAIIWLLFRTLILNKDINIKPLLTAIGNKFKDDKDDDDDDDEYETLTEEDVVMVDVEEIKSTSK